MDTQSNPNGSVKPAALRLTGSFPATLEPAIYVSMEYSDDYDDYHGKGSWKWVAKRTWTFGGATRTEILEVPQSAEGVDGENVQTLIRALTREPVGSDVQYVVSRSGDEQKYVAIRIG